MPRKRALIKFAVIAGIVLVVAIGAAVVLLQTPDQYQLASAEESFIASKYDERLFALDREAIDSAYRAQFEHLVAIWFKDETGQPARAINGAKIARKRYIDIMTAIEKREADLGKLRELQR